MEAEDEMKLPLLTINKKSNEKTQNPPKTGDGLVKYEELIKVLSCVQCGEFAVGGSDSGGIIYCRKGHIHCHNCRKKMAACRICKQRFGGEEANVVLGRILSLLALKCRHEGCEEFLFIDKKLGHENFCPWRRLPCQFEDKGCSGVFPAKEIAWHHRMCKFANSPHPNVLPSMPTHQKLRNKK